MEPELKEKYTRLLDYIRSFDRVGVACSGGVDSTLLAYACCEALGPERVVVLFADSCLLAEEIRTNISEFIKRELPAQVTFAKIIIDSLSEDDFVRNDKNRCYVCKKRIYTALLAHLQESDIEYLMDGTNCDDLGQDRPGLKAIKEMHILTPLVEAGYRKTDVRNTAAALGLANAHLPSNSCLATRIDTHTSITDKRLREIEKLERFLQQRGYEGCRVRPRGNHAIIEVQTSDLDKITNSHERSLIISCFQQNGYHSVTIELSGRSR